MDILENPVTTTARPGANGSAPERVLCTAMRPTRVEPVAGLDRLSLPRRLWLGTVLTVLMLASYAATVCALAIFFSGVFLATENVATGAAFAEVAPRPQTYREAPSQLDLERDRAAFATRVSAGQGW